MKTKFRCAVLGLLCLLALAGCASAPEDAVPYSEDAVYAFLEEAALAENSQAAEFFRAEEGNSLSVNDVDAVVQEALNADGILNYYVSEYSWTSRPVGKDCVKLEVTFTYEEDAYRGGTLPEAASTAEGVHIVIQALNEGQFTVPLRITGESWSEADAEQMLSVAVDNADCPSTFDCSYLLAPAADVPRQMLVLFYEPTVDEATYSAYKTEMDAALDTMAAEILSQGLKDDEDLYRAAHDAVLDAAEYDMDMAEAMDVNGLTESREMGPEYTAYGAVVTGFTVCYGYATAYKLLCDRLELPCWTVAGTADGGEHQWNLVRVDDTDYLVDCTWDDASRDQYSYFLCAPDLESHQPADGWICGW